MPDKQIRKISLIGAGNLAWHLGRALVRAGFTVTEVCNRTASSGHKLASKLNARFVATPRDITDRSDLCLIAVRDSAIDEVASMLVPANRLVVHTSGSVDIKVLDVASRQTGVLYPLQTFSKRSRVGFRNVPICVESNSDDGEQKLLTLADALSANVQRVDSRQRLILHMAAVFAGNFPNFLYAVAADILTRNDISFDLLRPLIQQTAKNAGVADPFSRQTGPAVRGDTGVMNRHRELLSGNNVYSEIYDLISKSIRQYKSSDGKL